MEFPPFRRRLGVLLLGALGALLGSGVGSDPTPANAQNRVLTIGYVPTQRVQLAIWLERADGAFLATLAVTEAVAYRGIGNRPGATQMNSGFRWPYGRREGVLPIWAHARLLQPGAQPFPRVIFQSRAEGHASRSTNDYSPDDYFCLSFDQSRSQQDALDAVSCASVFSSDKGRYIRQEDVDASYSEPWETLDGGDVQRALSLTSLYPPRRDAVRCTLGGCSDDLTLASFQADARAAMPEIDAVTMATPAGDTPQTLLFTVPGDWPDGDYVLLVEAHTEGDHNPTYNPTSYPTPSSSDWDVWAESYGYPYRGQPAVLYRLPFTLVAGSSASVATAYGYAALHGEDGAIRPIDATITDDPASAPGSGTDRLRLDGQGRRLWIDIPSCDDLLPAPAPVAELAAETHPDPKNSHRWATLRFRVPTSMRALGRYQIRTSIEPFLEAADFEQGLPAKTPHPTDPDDVVALQAPITGAPGDLVEVTLADLNRETTYYVAVRAVTICNEAGTYATTEVVTTEIHYTTVSPCFVATAAYGTPMAADVQTLRGFRDRNLMPHPLGRALVGLYYELGPFAAELIRDDAELRAITRTSLRPLIALARLLD